MSHLIVGDGHYTGAPAELERWRALLVKARGAGLRELSILGDFFELWIALPGLMPAWQEALLEPLAELKADGVYLRYVVGNKDYYVSSWNRAAHLFDEVIEKSCSTNSDLGTLILAHGDLVNRADRQYRLWRAVSRSAPVQLLGENLPRALTRALSVRLAKGLQRTNLYHKAYYPEAELRARARELPAGAATLIYGHFHVFRELVEADKRIFSLPFLYAENAGVWIDVHGIQRFGA